MRYLFLLLMPILFIRCDLPNQHAGDQQLNFKKSQDSEFVIPANKSYVEPWSESDLGINHDQGGSNNQLQIDVNEWESPAINLCWYLYMQPGDYKFNVEAMLEEKANSQFKLLISGTDDTTFTTRMRTFEMKGNGDFVTYTDLVDCTIKIPAFYKLELKPVSKTNQKFATVRHLIVKSESDAGAVRFANWLSSPSVHLNYSTADDERYNFEWLHGEVLVPEGADPLYTFYMCIGFFRGYFGMQVNHENERRILFSVWDSSEEPVDRDNVEQEDRVLLKGRGPNVTIGSFGNEGTGGQSYRVYPWKTGVPVQFLMNVRHLAGNKILLSAWFKQTAGEDWQYMATWEAPRDSRYFNGFHSFIENFGTGTGQLYRKAYYYNLWGKTVDQKEWKEFTKARMTHTDGDDNSRSDFGGGVSADDSTQFYMWSGGYQLPDYNEVNYCKPTHQPPLINTDSLEKKIDKVLLSQVKDRHSDHWRILNYSSQEANGEGSNNGHAKHALDNDHSTFWHTQWSGGKANYPHFLVIDMGEPECLNGLTFYQRADKSNGRIKEMVLEVSNDADTWNKIAQIELANTAGQQVVRLETPIVKKYLRLTVLSGYSDQREDVFFTHLAEINYF